MKKCSSSCEADWTVFQGTIWFFKSDLEKKQKFSNWSLHAAAEWWHTTVIQNRSAGGGKCKAAIVSNIETLAFFYCFKMSMHTTVLLALGFLRV